MSKRISKLLIYWTLLVLVQIYGLAIYQYGQSYGFDEQINPTTIIAAILTIIGLLGLIGRYLNNKDMKRGYCESGIAQEQIDAYQKSRNGGHLMEDVSKASDIKDAISQKNDYENDHDTKR
ncbi:hypothetical protein [Sulfuricurvum sp.]|uniref:hypothetical protein n=1 Tax=Sulfuricurvum sp. TaxID=2025608 RepID=UPI002604E23B|nr:hypothetical protein [Sulfuricurvum sp.]MDD2781671.1 hypothetical protein [Sulfuricurvum sp.]